ncbi:cytidylyltransferase domain-containing protein [Kiloniella majae]|uniref:acylneuraminate cytidylyltransferase family protein n=1 Tax=Kiloniella majae TaxID=1938558 RepID=UPI000A279487|nr:acylneuraminate cytidylyltransferase family protein [Kiloniella majae]
MKFLAIIPARGGSKGIPQKNIVDLNGKPLIAYTLEAVLKAKCLDRVVVSTDDNAVKDVVKEFGVDVITRPSELAEDKTPTLPVLQDVISQLAAKNNYLPEAVVTLQPTSPLRSSQHIDEAIELFKANPAADSLVSCVEVPHNFHPLSVMKQNNKGYLTSYIKQDETPLRRQDKDLVFARNGAAIYITKTTRLKNYIFGGNLLPYIMDESFSHDVDTIADLRQIEQILQNK